MIENLTRARAEYDAQLAAIGEDAQKAVAKFFGSILPEGFAVQWSQYTPYFNDGDACTFSVCEPTVFRVADRKVEDDYAERVEEGDDNTISMYQFDRYGVEKYEAYGHTYSGTPEIEGLPRAVIVEFEEAWKHMPEDLLERAFGDHVRITILSGGKAIVGECEHD
jgi:hypothetical protein